MEVGELYKVEIDQALAKDLLRTGGFLLLLNVPQGSVIGLDQQSSIVGPNFKGYKMIPPGAHILHYNPISKQGELSATMNQYIFVKPKQVLLQKWDTESELLVPVEEEDEVERHAMGVARMDFDAGLAPYNIHAYPTWRKMTNHIQNQTIESLRPVNRNFSITAETVAPGASQSSAEQNLQNQLANLNIPGRQAQAQQDVVRDANETITGTDNMRSTVGRCFYKQVPRRMEGKGLTAEELTSLHLDKSQLLQNWIQKDFNGNLENLLGQFQFAFTAFLCGQSLEGFSVWKDMLHLLLNCEKYPCSSTEGSSLYIQILITLEAQIASSLSIEPKNGEENPGEELISMQMLDGVLANSFLKQLLAQFFEILNESENSLPAALLEACQKLQSTIKERLEWDFSITDWQDEDSDDEFRPVIVET